MGFRKFGLYFVKKVYVVIYHGEGSHKNIAHRIRSPLPIKVLNRRFFNCVNHFNLPNSFIIRVHFPYGFVHKRCLTEEVQWHVGIEATLRHGWFAFEM